MAERSQGKEFNPRHRIVGAIVLVALAVVLIPLVLDEETPPTGSPSLTEGVKPNTKVVVTQLIPKEEEPPAAHPVLPTPPAPAAPENPTVPPADEAAAPQAVPPAEPQLAAPEPQLAEQPKKPEKRAAKGWIVQVGVYSKIENARHQRDALRKHGFKPEFDDVRVKDGKGTRVRVGPFPDQAEARAAQARIQSTAGIKGVVLSYP